jgi:hypothetical protein
MNFKDIMEAGGPAFATGSNYGMTLRDWFASQALIGMMAYNGTKGCSHMANVAYEYADAMLAARKNYAHKIEEALNIK